MKSGDGERLYAPGTGLQEALYFWIFPNLMLNVYPDNVSTNLIMPISQDKTLTVFEWFFHDAASSESKGAHRKAVQFSDEVHRKTSGCAKASSEGCVRRLTIAGGIRLRRENGVHSLSYAPA